MRQDTCHQGAKNVTNQVEKDTTRT